MTAASPLTEGNWVALRCSSGGYIGKVSGVSADEIILEDAEYVSNGDIFNCVVLGDGSRGVKHEGAVSVTRSIVLGVEQLAEWPPKKSEKKS